jgi:hypothetical protein
MPKHREALRGVDGHRLDDIGVGHFRRQVSELTVDAGDYDGTVATDSLERRGHISPVGAADTPA